MRARTLKSCSAFILKMPSAAGSKIKAPIQQGGFGKNYGASKIRDMKKFKANSKPTKQKNPTNPEKPRRE